MRRGFGLAWALVSLLVVGVATWLAYNAGLVQGLAQGGRPVDGTAAVPYPYPYHEGFGFFPFFLFIVLLFVVLRRPWGHRHWSGTGHWGRPGGMGGPGWGGELPPPIEERMQAWHQRAHSTTPPAADAEAAKPQG